MSNLISKYEISVWDDILVNGEFIEEKVCVIGSDTMPYQGKVIEPQFTRRANGEKKLTFQLYKTFIDNITGEKVQNVFYNYLINERKVKLYYEDKWYDFVIKNIVENSSNYLYTYQLEDALVQELSKNGFDKAFDVELQNNLGTAKELAERTLEGTDWTVESDIFTEKVEESLVYLLVSEDIKANHIYSDINDNIIDIQEKSIPKNSIVLAFYSCCKNKPHRFQFIYLDEKYDEYNRELVSIDENRIITIPNCQYYIDINSNDDYISDEEGYYLPQQFSVIKRSGSVLEDNTDTTISNWYKGKRFGFVQKTEYVPLLETYANIFYKTEEVEGEIKQELYYGYPNTEFNSPTFTENVITNSEFKGNSGWTGSYAGGTKNAKTVYGAEVESVYGKFYGDYFYSAQESVGDGNFNFEESKQYESFLRIRFPQQGIDTTSNQPFVINSGFYDNRTKIANISPGEQWCLDLQIFGHDGAEWDIDTISNELDFKLQIVNYDVASGGHKLGEVWGELKKIDNRLFIEIPKDAQLLTKEQFKNQQIKLVISPAIGAQEQNIYIKQILLYKKVLNEKEEIIEPGKMDLDGVVNTFYSFCKVSEVNKAETLEKVKMFNIKKDEIDYSTYVPLYNEGAQKTRTISIKESNYFNILQSIAETFEAWLEIIAERDELNKGQIKAKKVRFRKYLGSDNYASFKYGVNLKDIQRSFESKKLVTKLIVKQNSNELGQNGFCTIARAGSNPTGENNIYDFRYFHNKGMLNPTNFVSQMYYKQNPYTQEIEQGKDVSNELPTNVQNYFNRIKKLNDEIKKYSDKANGVKQELVKLEAELAVEEGLKIAAEEGIADTKDRFYTMVGVYPDEVGQNPFSKIELDSSLEKPWGDLEKLNPSWNDDLCNKITVKYNQNGEQSNSQNWSFTVDSKFDDSEPIALPEKIAEEDQSVTEGLKPFGDITANYGEDGSIWIETNGEDKEEYAGIIVSPKEGYKENYQYRMSYTINAIEGRLFSIGTHCASFENNRISLDGGITFEYGDVCDVPYVLDGNMGEPLKVIIEGTFAPLSRQDDAYPYWFIQPNRGEVNGITCVVKDLEIRKGNGPTKSKESTFYIEPTFNMYRDEQEEPDTIKTIKIPCSIAPYQVLGFGYASLGEVNISGSSIQKILTEYIEYQKQFNESEKKLMGEQGLIQLVSNKKNQVTQYEQQIDTLKEWKNQLNEAFYSTYSRFIQEGTWISENYIDDDKYYNDALSVLYNSSYPQVAYTINVLTLSSLPGYEYFKFQLGDKTYVEDPEFFGSDDKIEVVITEQNNFLDDDSKSTVKVQNFKNQFQDLFQKITATVQQTQYSVGSYEKAVALAEANVQTRGKFVTDALSGMSGKLAVAGQTTVVQDQYGITLTDSITKDEMRLIGGAILMSIQDPDTGERSWKTGLTPEGISASLITTGTLNAGNITIMNADEPVFRWDAFGLSAFDIEWSNGVISGKVNPYKFVRFDKYGIYGISNENIFVPEEINSKNQASNQQKEQVIDGRSWKPSSAEEILDRATFALTWEGIKIKSDSVETLIGHKDGKIVDIINTQTNENIFSIDDTGNLSISGVITAKAGGTIGGWKIGDNYLCTTDSDGNIHNVGKGGSFCIYSSGKSTTGTVGGSPDTANLWRLTIGENFGVASDGTLYAKGAVMQQATINSINLQGNIHYNESNCTWNQRGFSLQKGMVGFWEVKKAGQRDYNLLEYTHNLQGTAYADAGESTFTQAFVTLNRDEVSFSVYTDEYGDLGYIIHSIKWRDLIYYLHTIKWIDSTGTERTGISGIYQNAYPKLQGY